MRTPYYQNEQFGITIYRAENTEVLPELPGIGALITDPPYSSGGAFRTDRGMHVPCKAGVKGDE